MAEKRVCFRFSNLKDRHRQMAVFVAVVPSLMMERVTLYHGEPELVVLDSSAFEEAQAKSFLLECTELGIERAQKVKFEDGSKVNLQAQNGVETSLWTLVKWDSFRAKQDHHYAWITQDRFERIVRDCYSLGLFRLSYLHYQTEGTDRILLQIPAAPRMLLLKIEEEYGGKIFWKDSFGIYYPMDSTHPMSRWWSSELGDALVFREEIHVLKEAAFQPVLESVSFHIEPTQLCEKSVQEVPRIEIEVHLIPSTKAGLDEPELWYYRAEDKGRLEEWISHLSARQHEAFLLYCLSEPIPGFLLKKSRGVSHSAVPPAAARESFYRLFKGEDIFLPLHHCLSPPIPLDQILALSPFSREEGLVFFQEDSHLLPAKLKHADFVHLSQLVYYLLEDSTEALLRASHGFCLKDPKILIQEHCVEVKQEQEGIYPPTEGVQVPQPSQMSAGRDQQGQEVPEPPDEEIDPFDHRAKMIIGKDRAAMVREMRERILEDPYIQDPEPWHLLAQVEMEAENYSDAGILFEIALSYSVKNPQRAQIARAIMHCSLQGKGGRSEVQALHQTSPASLKVEELGILGLDLLKQESRMDPEQLQEFAHSYVPIFEEFLDQMPVLRCWNLAVSFYQILKPGSYFLYRARDRVLYRLLDEGLFGQRAIPGLLSFSTDPSESTLKDVSDRYLFLAGRLGEEETEAPDWILFHLVFAAGFALRQSSGRMQENLEAARERVSNTPHPVHQALYETYSQRSQEFLEGRGVNSPSNPPKILQSLSMAHRYYLSTVRDHSLLLGSVSSPETEEFALPGFQNRSAEDLLQKVIPQNLRNLKTAMPGMRERQSQERAKIFHSILGVLPEVGELAVFEFYPELHKLCPTLQMLQDRGRALGRMLVISSQFERQDWVQALSGEYLEILEQAFVQDSEVVSSILTTVLEVFPRVLERDLSHRVAHRLLDWVRTQSDGARVKVLISRLFDSLGDGELACELCEEVFSSYDSCPLPEKIDLLACMLKNWNGVSLEFRSLICEKILGNLRIFEDHLSLNDSFSLSKLLVLEYLVAQPGGTEALSREAQGVLYAIEHSWKQNLSQRFADLLKEEYEKASSGG